MSKIKRTPVPLPGSKPKSPFKAQTAPSKLALSPEFIESSDDSEAAPRERTKEKTKEKKKEKLKEKAKEKATKSQPTTSIAVHRPKTNGVSKKAEIVAPVLAPEKVVKKPVQAIASSSEEESEDDDEEATNSKNNTGDKVDVEMKDSTSDSDSSSEESEEEAALATVPQATVNHSKPQSHAVDFRPAQAYVPPNDFTLIPTPFNNASPATSLFSALEGKQIWHITAPASVSLSSIRDLALDKALNLNGTSYEFSAGDKDEQATRSVLIPSQKGFKAVPTRISKTLHLRQSVQLPESVANPPPPTSEPQSFITSTAVRIPRPQIKGLKMNFFPSGSDSNERCLLGDTDSEDDAPARTKPATVVSELPSAKRKHKEKDGGREEREGSVTKKSKKHRTPEEVKAREEKKARKEKKKERAKP